MDLVRTPIRSLSGFVFVALCISLVGCDDGPSAPQNEAPMALFSISTGSLPFARVDRIISFDASESNDPDGSIVSYAWTTNGTADNEGVSINKSFDSPGQHEIVLTVTDNAGASATARKTLTVRGNRKPIAEFIYTTPTYINRPIVFDAARSLDPDGSISTYRWEINGSFVSGAGRFEKEFPRVGEQTIRLTVTDSDGASTSTSTQIAITLSGGDRDCKTFAGNHSLLSRRWPSVFMRSITMTFDTDYPSSWWTRTISALSEWHWNSDARIEFRYFTSAVSVCNTSCNEDRNVITIRNIDGSGGTLAQASYWYSSSTGLITEVDVQVDRAENWSIASNPASNQFDLQSVMTHEFGHVLRLGHSSGFGSEFETMFATTRTGSTRGRTLYCGDKRGAQTLYGFHSRIRGDSDGLNTFSEAGTLAPERPVVVVSSQYLPDVAGF